MKSHTFLHANAFARNAIASHIRVTASTPSIAIASKKWINIINKQTIGNGWKIKAFLLIVARWGGLIFACSTRVLKVLQGLHQIHTSSYSETRNKHTMQTHVSPLQYASMFPSREMHPPWHSLILTKTSNFRPRT